MLRGDRILFRMSGGRLIAPMVNARLIIGLMSMLGKLYYSKICYFAYVN